MHYESYAYHLLGASAHHICPVHALPIFQEDQRCDQSKSVDRHITADFIRAKGDSIDREPVRHRRINGDAGQPLAENSKTFRFSSLVELRISPTKEARSFPIKEEKALEL